MSENLTITAYHAGGRGLTGSFLIPNIFHKDSYQVLFEADPDAVSQMKNPTSKEIEVLGPHSIYPFCLGAANSKKKLYITNNPYASSNFEPNPYMYQFYAELSHKNNISDVTYDDMLKVDKILEVETFSLDNLILEGRLDKISPPDFLSIDTQGSELEILKGAKSALSKSILGVIVEFEFIQMYKLQPLFSDIFAHMNELGFIFSGFITLQEISIYRAPLGARGKGFPGFGDALFLRKSETIPSLASSNEHLYLMLHKLAFMAINFSHIEYAIYLLEFGRSIQIDYEFKNKISSFEYFKFLKEFDILVNKIPNNYPKLFGSNFSFRHDMHVKQTQINISNKIILSGIPEIAKIYFSKEVDLWLEIPGRVRHLFFSRPDLAFKKIFIYCIIKFMNIKDICIHKIKRIKYVVNTNELVIFLNKYGFNSAANDVAAKIIS